MTLTNQAVLDMAVKGLAAQGWKPSSHPIAGCSYRGEEGRKCAIGHCIPDSMYTRDMDMDDSSIGRVLAKFPKIRALFATCNKAFLADLQVAHDGDGDGDARFKGPSPEEMRERVSDVAAKYFLTMPEGA